MDIPLYIDELFAEYLIEDKDFRSASALEFSGECFDCEKKIRVIIARGEADDRIICPEENFLISGGAIYPEKLGSNHKSARGYNWKYHLKCENCFEKNNLLEKDPESDTYLKPLTQQYVEKEEKAKPKLLPEKESNNKDAPDC